MMFAACGVADTEPFEGENFLICEAASGGALFSRYPFITTIPNAATCTVPLIGAALPV